MLTFQMKRGEQVARNISYGITVLGLLTLVMGCASYDVIPDHLEGQVNQQLTFVDVRDNPERYKGEIMVVGGEVLSIDRQTDGTQFEVLQLPLTDYFIPMDRRSTTQGRFLALSGGKDSLDPAVVEKGVAISVVGEIVGRTTINIGEDAQEVPLFGIKDLTIWEEQRYWGRPSYYGMWDWGYPGFYRGYRPFGYPYYR